MQRFFLYILVLLLSTLLSAQSIAVKSFVKLENDLDARVNAPLKDLNGDICAIIKVQTTQKGFFFDGGQLGIVKTVDKPGEIWVYVPYGLKRITISHENLGVLRDYMLPLSIEKATVYELVLVSGKVNITLDETIVSQWLVINATPADAAIYIDDMYAKNGTYQQKLKPGSYTYRIEAPLYHTEAGKIEIGNTKKELAIQLKPAHGFINISSTPERGAKVIVDGKTLTQTTPCTTEAMASGEHTVQVLKEMYQPKTQKITVTDGQTTPANFALQPNFAELNIIAPSNATLYINNQQKESGTWKGRLNAGIYSVEARLEKHRTAKQDVELMAGDVKTITLNPTPIYGSLDIVTTPTGAKISINGKDYGTTPNTISDLLIGDYSVVLTKEGYTTAIKTATVIEGKTSEVIETLINGINSNNYPVRSNQSNTSNTYIIKRSNSDIVIENPNFTGKSSGDNPKIIAITLTDKETIIDMKLTAVGDKESWCSSDKHTYIQDYYSLNKYTLIKAVNIKYRPKKTILMPNESLSFRLIFPPIPKDTKSINLIEKDVDYTENARVWKFFDIKLK